MKHDLEIKDERPSINVLHVQVHPLRKGKVVSAADLPETGNSGSNRKATAMPILVKAIVVANRERAGTDEAHVALKNIKELRQFVDACAPEKFSDWRNAGICLDLENWPVHLVQGLKFGLQLFSTGNHGAKLVKTKATLVQANAILNKKEPVRGT